VAVTGAFFLVLAVGLAVLFAALANLSPVLIDAQPALQLLGAALFLRRRVPLALLLTQRVEFRLQGVVTRAGRFVGISHGVLLVVRTSGPSSYETAPAAAWPGRRSCRTGPCRTRPASCRPALYRLALPYPALAGCDGNMPDVPILTLPLLRLGRLQLDPGLRDLRPGSAGSGLVVTAALAVPESGTERQYAWEVAWTDAAREAVRLGADQATADVLTSGAGDAFAGGIRVVVAVHGQVLLARWLAPGAAGSVRVGPLPHLLEVAAAAARRPAFVVVLADRDGTDVIAHGMGDEQPAGWFPASNRPGAEHDPHPDRPPAQLHGPRHVTDREPISGGQRNAEFIAGRVVEAAQSVAAHVVLGAGDQHILDAVGSHLADSVGPITTVAGGRHPDGHDQHLAVEIGAALDEITTAATGAVADRVASLADGPGPGAVRGIAAVAEQLAEQQVAVLLVAADLSRDSGAGQGYRIGVRPTEFLVGETDIGVEVPLDAGLAWAALHQDAIVAEVPDRSGALAGEPVGALLRRGPAG
jgi:Bacterial archaeo-eukaryotic release factor family 2